MPRRNETPQQEGPLGRIASAVKRLFRRKNQETDEVASEGRASALRARPREAQEPPHAERAPRRQADVPLDVIEKAYTPPMTSSKASFRSDGSDHQRDQELVYGVAGEQWKDEDRLTNKSGDPRIGTHRRTYEPDEARPESRH